MPGGFCRLNAMRKDGSGNSNNFPEHVLNLCYSSTMRRISRKTLRMKQSKDRKSIKTSIIGIILLSIAILPATVLSITFGPNSNYEIITGVLAVSGLCLFGFGLGKWLLFPE